MEEGIRQVGECQEPVRYIGLRNDNILVGLTVRVKQNQRPGASSREANMTKRRNRHLQKAMG